MASIGELFKTLGKDETFSKYCSQIENGKSNSEIINLAFEDDNLVSILKKIIDDTEIIKTKMEVIIGQKRKVYESKKDKLLKNLEQNSGNVIKENTMNLSKQSGDTMNLSKQSGDTMNLSKQSGDTMNLSKQSGDTMNLSKQSGDKELFSEEHIEENNDIIEDNYLFNFKPINNDKVVWLNKYSFVEQIDHRMRLVNYDIEMYY
jgi:hypothetical protein